MTIQHYILCFAVLFSSCIYAQRQDYIITNSRDTVYGNVKLVFLPFEKYLVIRTPEAKIKIANADVHEYRRAHRKFMFVRDTTARGKIWLIRCEVVLDGKMRVLEEWQQDVFDNYIYYDGRYYPAINHHISDTVWNILVTCPAFEEKYGHYRAETAHKKIMILPRQLRVWKEMVGYFNRHCERDIPE